MFSSSGVKVIFCKTMCFALKRMQSYPQPSARKLCEAIPGLGESVTSPALHVQCLRVFHRMHLWKFLKLRLKSRV